ncbi:MAG: uroporphyrinogen decarboxylase family protein, partial [Candidatus Kariarchaeaceae archaeon]
MHQKERYATVMDFLRKKTSNDAPFFSLWKHFPYEDTQAKSLAEAQIRFQKNFNVDIMKIAPHGRYCAVDWGAEIYFPEITESVSGSSRCSKYSYNELSDWQTLEKVDPLDGEFGKQIRVIELVEKNPFFDDNRVPKMMTIFNPVMTGAKLSKDERFVKDLLEEPDLLLPVLDIFVSVVSEFARACLDAGCEGIFFCTQQAQESEMTSKEYKKYVLASDLKVLRKIGKKADFVVMHVHGENVYYDLVKDNYPITAINWHDYDSKPSLLEGSEKTNKLVFGGLDENKTLREGTDEEVKKQILS